MILADTNSLKKGSEFLITLFQVFFLASVMQNISKTKSSDDGSCPDNMFALKVSQQRLLAKSKRLIYRVLCWLFVLQSVLARSTRSTNTENRNMKLYLFSQRNITQVLSDLLSELFFNSSTGKVTAPWTKKNLKLVLGRQAVKQQYTKMKYLSTYRLCFWNRHDVFQSHSIKLPQHFLWLRLEDSRNKQQLNLQDRVVMLCSKSRP